MRKEVLVRVTKKKLFRKQRGRALGIMKEVSGQLKIMQK
jgi:hypothetical protein